METLTGLVLWEIHFRQWCSFPTIPSLISLCLLWAPTAPVYTSLLVLTTSHLSDSLFEGKDWISLYSLHSVWHTEFAWKCLSEWMIIYLLLAQHRIFEGTFKAVLNERDLTLRVGLEQACVLTRNVRHTLFPQGRQNEFKSNYLRMVVLSY